jgi:hypothetical protein
MKFVITQLNNLMNTLTNAVCASSCFLFQSSHHLLYLSAMSVSVFIDVPTLLLKLIFETLVNKVKKLILLGEFAASRVQ